MPKYAHVYDILNCGPRHRFIGNNKALSNSGGQRSNKQNLPRKSTLRQAIQAPKGYQLMVCDSAGVEMRSMFHVAGQLSQIAHIKAGEDVYIKAAESIYHRPIDKILDHDERAVGKVQMLSLQYGCGWKKMRYIFAAGLMGPAVVLTEAEAKNIHHTYQQQNPKVRRFWGRADEMIVNMAYGNKVTYRTPTTREPLFTTEQDKLFLHSREMYLHFKELKQDQAGGWWYNNRGHQNKIYGGMLTGRLNQGFARDIVFWQINKIAKKYPLVLRVHDEGVFIVPDDPEAILEAETYALKWFHNTPNFAAGLPLKGEVITGKEYLKP